MSEFPYQFPGFSQTISTINSIREQQRADTDQRYNHSSNYNHIPNIAIHEQPNKYDGNTDNQNYHRKSENIIETVRHFKYFLDTVYHPTNLAKLLS